MAPTESPYHKTMASIYKRSQWTCIIKLTIKKLNQSNLILIIIDIFNVNIRGVENLFVYSFLFQYGVAVTKYDRHGFRARMRQLLLTTSSAVMVQEAKIKQRIDYGTLLGNVTVIQLSPLLPNNTVRHPSLLKFHTPVFQSI